MSGFVVWMTGLSGAGKSTLAAQLTLELSQRGVHVECLDGDEVRKNLSHGLGFSREDRDRNVRRIGYVARMIARSGACSITAAISPYRALRDEIRSRTENFIEVYCECPLDVLTERDPKGLYRRALAGEIKNFTGVDDPYEAPESPDVLLRTDRSTPEECIQKILSTLEDRGLLRAHQSGPSVLPPPFGGEVFEARVATPEELSGAEFQIEVGDSLAEEITAVGGGLYSPVTGFMTEREAVKVEKGAALERGTPWWDQPFVLPCAAEPPPVGSVALLTHGGRTHALMQVHQVWQQDSQQFLAGPIDALAPSALTPMSARTVRRNAIKSGWERIAAVFVEDTSNTELRSQLAVIQQFVDGVVLVHQQSDEARWNDLDLPDTIRVRVPQNFPISNTAARQVVARSVGAFASHLIK